MADPTPPASNFEFTLEPHSDRYDDDDERWQNQVADLVSGLRQEVTGVRQGRTTVEGAKGGVESVIVALGSAGAITAAVEFFRSWLHRDRSRSLDISWAAEDGLRRVSIRGDAVDQATLQMVAEAATRQLGGGQGPWAATEPS